MTETDHTCNGGCHRCSTDLDAQHWRHQADLYRNILTAILSNISDPVVLNWVGNPNVVILNEHQFITDVHTARRLLPDVST